MGAVMRKAALAALGVLFLLLLGCNNPMLARLQELAGVTTQGVPSGPTVYVAGSLNNGTSPCYWVNGVKHDMALPSGASSCSVNSIVASNGTVYVAGTYFNGGKPYPCLWTNGAAQDLQLLAGASMGTANAIAGSAGQLCIAGSCTGASDIPCQWLNGAPSSLALPGGALGGSATSVSIYQAKPYIGGLYVNASSVLTFCYWPMGGGYKDLPLPGGDSTAGGQGDLTSIATDYTAGYCVNGTAYTACYWHGTVGLNLIRPGGNFDAKAFGIAVSGSSFTAVGYYSKGGAVLYPCSWVDGVAKDLDMQGSTYGIAYSVCISGGVTYIVGQSTVSGVSRASCWVNGVRQDLPGTNGIATSVFVQ